MVIDSECKGAACHTYVSFAQPFDRECDQPERMPDMTEITMEAKWTQEEIDQAFVEVRKKAIVDKPFRDVLLKDPHKAIKQVTQKDVPAMFKIKVVEADPNYHMTFVLPQMVSDELSDEELEKVAGGDCIAEACAGQIQCGGQVSRG